MEVVKEFPIGRLKIETKNNKIIKIVEVKEPITNTNDELLNRVIRELNEYFIGKRKDFSFLVELTGTEFEKTVLKHLMDVDYGNLISYSKLAENIKSKTYARAVARVVANNQLLIIVPCHRVVRKDGYIGGFRLGEESKRYLLNLEKKFAKNN